MPIFRTTAQIFLGEGEFYDPNWMDSDKLILPPSEQWDYSRELRIEDVNIWEVIAEPWDVGIYAAWDPFAEFFLIRYETDYRTNPHYQDDRVKGLPRKFQFEVFYGKDAQKFVLKRAKQLGVNLNLNKVWVDPEHMWLYV
jgi:hypothetical protein